MTWTPLNLRNLFFLGPVKPLASLEFQLGVNVIWGASDTGKSFIVEALDFLLGSSGPLMDITERIGYDRARISVETAERKLFTIQRSVEGGDFLCFEGLEKDYEPDDQGLTLKAKHSAKKEDNLSRWLLSHIGLQEKRIRKNQQGVTLSLSFRNLARLVLVKEEEIIRKHSPFWSGQNTSKTSDKAALKLLLTGIDDSSLVADEDNEAAQSVNSAKIELIDQWLQEFEAEISETCGDPKEIESQVARLEETIQSQREDLQAIQQSLDEAIVKRREVRRECEEVSNRSSEIEELLARFDLLAQHYKIDLDRLAAIEESGSLFVHQDRVHCPLCGAEPDAQHIDESCEGDVEAVVAGARAETEKIKRLEGELQQTIRDLTTEAEELTDRLSDIEAVYLNLDTEIRERLAPTVGSAQTTFAEVVEKRSEVKRIADLHEQRNRLEQQKMELSEGTSTGQDAGPTHLDLSKTILGAFSKKVEDILSSWNFPGANRVYFDEKAIDFVIDDKPRGSRGKGLRAITHAAASIALMEYCKERDLPHPGFVVLDSPLLAYKEPEGEEDDLRGTDVKDRFYEYLVTNHNEGQVIVLENEAPPQSISDSIHLTTFTKNPHKGRYGFFPHS